MLDIQFIRDNAELVQRKTEEKGYKNISISDLLKIDEARRTVLAGVEDLRAQRNTLTAEMKGQKPTEDQIEKGKQLREKVNDAEAKLRDLDEQFWPALKAVPNIALDMVPVGATEEENVVVRTFGEQP